MQWKKAQRCVVCQFPSKKGERIHGRFMCEQCEKDMVETLAKEHEDQEWMEMQRISTQRFNDEYRM